MNECVCVCGCVCVSVCVMGWGGALAMGLAWTSDKEARSGTCEELSLFVPHLLYTVSL